MFSPVSTTVGFSIFRVLRFTLPWRPTSLARLSMRWRSPLSTASAKECQCDEYGDRNRTAHEELEWNIHREYLLPLQTTEHALGESDDSALPQRLKHPHTLHIQAIADQGEHHQGRRPKDDLVAYMGLPTAPIHSIEAHAEEEAGDSEEEVPIRCQEAKEPQAGERAQPQGRKECRSDAADPRG